MKKTQLDRRITRLTNKQAFLNATLVAMKGCTHGNAVTLCGLAKQTAMTYPQASVYSMEEWIEAVEDRLDEIIEPDNPIVEWLTDVGIHVAAAVAVYVYTNRTKLVESRLERIGRMLDVAKAKRDSLAKKKIKKTAKKKTAKKKAAKKAAKTG